LEKIGIPKHLPAIQRRVMAKILRQRAGVQGANEREAGDGRRKEQLHFHNGSLKQYGTVWRPVRSLKTKKPSDSGNQRMKASTAAGKQFQRAGLILLFDGEAAPRKRDPTSM
jgi:hypothetical protein